MTVRAWFPTLIYDAQLDPEGPGAFHEELLAECYTIREVDIDGQEWCEENYDDGFTSYGSMCRLHEMSPMFRDLEERIDRHVRSYARSLQFDLEDRELTMTDCWVNIMPRGCAHSLHLHPTSTISGTYYVKTPAGCSSLRFEDPRLAHQMAAPPRKASVRDTNRMSVDYPAKAGKVVLFESWLRHEVRANRVDAERVSVSFNYNWF